MGVGVITGVALGQSSVSLLARVLGNAGTPITFESISTLAWTLTNLTAGTAVATGTFSPVSSVVFDSLQLDPRWTVDGIGYNVLLTIPASNFPLATPQAGVGVPAPQRYQLDAAFTLASGQAFRVSWQWSSLPVYG